MDENSNCSLNIDEYDWKVEKHTSPEGAKVAFFASKTLKIREVRLDDAYDELEFKFWTFDQLKNFVSKLHPLI